MMSQIKYDHNHFQGREQSQPWFEGKKRTRKRTTTRKRTCNIKEEGFETTAGDVALSLLGEIIEKGKTQADPGQQVVEDNHDCDPKASIVSQSFSESDMSSYDDSLRQNQNPCVAWREPKRGRKIQTTSLVLKRRKKIKGRHKQREPVLRLRGGGDDDHSGMSSKQDERKSDEPCSNEDIEIDNRGYKPPPKKRLRTQNYVARDWPDQLTTESRFEKSCQRPAPMSPPREQDLSFGNMTTDCIESEDGQEIFSSFLDSYRRTNAQIEAVKEAGADQRKVGGGVYQIKDKSQKFVTIQKGWASKDIGLTFATIEDGVVQTKSKCFAMMSYEPFHFCKHTPGLRLRKKQPEETHTGYVWYGYGGDLMDGSCSVYTFCERAGERDLHFSEEGCNRLSEAPGASQQMCMQQPALWCCLLAFFAEGIQQGQQRAMGRKESE